MSVPRLHLTQALVDRLPPRVDKRGPITVMDPPPGWYAAQTRRILDERPEDGALWVFAIGSLIWQPKFPERDRRAAHVRGWRRAFCINDRRFRGNPDAPGLMMGLHEGGDCAGVAIRMDDADLDGSLRALLEKEPPVPAEWVNAETPDGPLRAIAFAVNDSFPLYRPEPPLPDLARILASAVGHVGTMAGYLLNTARELERHGIHDPHLWQLQEAVARHLEALPGLPDARPAP